MEHIHAVFCQCSFGLLCRFSLGALAIFGSALAVFR